MERYSRICAGPTQRGAAASTAPTAAGTGDLVASARAPPSIARTAPDRYLWPHISAGQYSICKWLLPTPMHADAGVHEQARSLPPAPAATPPIAAPTGVRAGLNTPVRQSAAGLRGGFTPMPPNTPPPPHVKPVAGFASPLKSGCSSPGGIAASPHGPGGGEAFATNLSVRFAPAAGRWHSASIPLDPNTRLTRCLFRV